MSETSAPLQLRVPGHVVFVRRQLEHPEGYLWIDIDDRTFFLGHYRPGMTRGEVRRMALRWLQERSGRAK